MFLQIVLFNLKSILISICLIVNIPIMGSLHTVDNKMKLFTDKSYLQLIGVKR